MTKAYTWPIYLMGAAASGPPKPKLLRRPTNMAQSKDPNFRRRQSVTFTLSAAVVEGLDALSADTRRSRSSFVEEALEELLKRYRPEVGVKE